MRLLGEHRIPYRRRQGSFGHWAVALLFLALAAPFARSQSADPGSLEGRLTDLHSRPLRTATLVLRNDQTGEEVRAAIGKAGTYRFDRLAPGTYTREGVSSAQGAGQVQGIVILPGYASRIQTAVDLAPQAEAPSSPLTASMTRAAPVVPEPAAPEFATAISGE